MKCEHCRLKMPLSMFLRPWNAPHCRYPDLVLERMLVEFGIWQGRKEKAKENSEKGDRSERQLSNDLMDVFVS